MTNPTFPKRIRTAKWIEQFVPKAGDGLCPGFWKGAPGAFGCPYSCNYCFLNRAKRLAGEQCVLYPLPQNPNFRLAPSSERGICYRNDERLTGSLRWAHGRQLSFINWGESADSLAGEAETGFLRRLVGWYTSLTGRDSQFISLLLTKSSGDGWLSWVLDQEPTEKIVFAFSVTDPETAYYYEKGPPHPNDRLQAAGKLIDAGWRVRLRVDPIAPTPNPPNEAQSATKWTCDLLWNMLAPLGTDLHPTVTKPPELITLGTLRFNTPHPLVKQFGMERDEGGRWRLPLKQRVELYKAVVEAVDGRVPVALCKEVPECWEAVFGEVPNPEDIRCNCTP